MKIDQVGLEKLKQKLEKINQDIDIVKQRKGKAFSEDTNSWHDNFEFDQANRELTALLYERAELIKTINEAEIIKSHDSADQIDIGDIVTLYDGDLDDELKVKLVSNFEDQDVLDIVTINSPLGSAIYKRKIGDKVKYSANNNTFEVEIKDIQKIFESEVNVNL